MSAKRVQLHSWPSGPQPQPKPRSGAHPRVFLISPATCAAGRHTRSAASSAKHRTPKGGYEAATLLGRPRRPPTGEGESPNACNPGRTDCASGPPRRPATRAPEELRGSLH